MLRRIESTSTSRGFGYISAIRQSIFQIVRESESQAAKRDCVLASFNFHTRVEPSVTRQKQATMELNFDVCFFFSYFSLFAAISHPTEHTARHIVLDVDENFLSRTFLPLLSSSLCSMWGNINTRPESSVYSSVGEQHTAYIAAAIVQPTHKKEERREIPIFLV